MAGLANTVSWADFMSTFAGDGYGKKVRYGCSTITCGTYIDSQFSVPPAANRMATWEPTVSTGVPGGGGGAGYS